MRAILTPMSIVSVILSGAIFGFFYAWVCSTMWGLDAADPRVAIAAMQAMNASVRNVVFAPAFFFTPFALAIKSILAFRTERLSAAVWFMAASLIYLLLGMTLTMTVNVRMNEALALQTVPDDIESARAIWQDYSQPWQFWNTTRTIASGISFVFAASGLLALGRENASSSQRIA